MKKAIITGVLGQDGYYLAELLLGKNYFVYGVYKNRDLNEIPIWQSKNIKLYNFDLNQLGLLEDLINEIQPDEIYHLAANHFSSQKIINSVISFIPFSDINIMVIDKILSIVYNNQFKTKVFYASSSHVFGDVKYYPQTENTPFNPNSFYSISKVAASNLCNFYRDSLGVFISVGILYNHESERRNPSFVTTQIATAAASAILGLEAKLYLRNLEAIVDWGAAKDYVVAMWHTLQQPISDNYIISSGIPRTINEFAKVAFEYVKLDAKKYIFQTESINKLQQKTTVYVGNPSKIQSICKWAIKYSFEDLVAEMVQFKINELKSKN
jgi:GDPmannose 4,6-dehydratase